MDYEINIAGHEENYSVGIRAGNEAVISGNISAAIVVEAGDFVTVKERELTENIILTAFSNAFSSAFR